MKEVFLIRGVSGAGKTTLAEALLNDTTLHVEADMFFMRDGEYKFDATKLSDAHKECFDTFTVAIADYHITRVIVSNTFTTLWEIQPYINYAKHHNCKLTVLTVEKCHDSANVHGVPEAVIRQQHERFQRIGGF